MTFGPTSKVELYDAFAVRFEGGAIGTFSGAGAVPDDKGFQLDVRVYGSEGLLILDIDRARLEVQRYDGNHFAMDLPGDAGAYECSGPTEQLRGHRAWENYCQPRAGRRGHACN